jgi:predicted GTPase
MLTRGAKWRIGVAAGLFLVPVAFLCGVGSYHLYLTGWSLWAWGGMTACFLAAYLLGWYWTRKGTKTVLPDPNYSDPLNYWTDRDRAAWKVVEKHALDTKPVSVDDFNNPDNLTRFAAEAQDLALKLARVYHPGTKEPFAHLTLPEILTAFELVSHDLSRLVDKYVPGSHLITLQNFKQAKQAMAWYETGRNIYWLVSAVFNPLQTAAQVLATKGGMQAASQQIQNNVMHWFYLTYVHELGRYFIELNSGRLRVGAKKYRELMEAHQVPPILSEDEAAKRAQAATAAAAQAAGGNAGSSADPTQVTVSIVGPVKAGKSSLINAALGDKKAAVDVVPLTAASTRYDLNQAGLPPISLIDTVGFGVEGAVEADIRNAVDAVKLADVVVLAVPARSAARAPEVNFLDRIRAAFAARPELRMPPVIVALTQIDHLTPAMEWAPPYDWEAGTRPKEKSIREAVAAAKEAFAGRVEDVIPVCGADGRVLNVREGLMPEVAARLSDARGVSLLRALHIDSAIHRTKKVVDQVWNVGKEVFKAVFKGK